MIRLRNRLAWWCSKAAEFFEELHRKLAVCEECGRNRFYGAPCYPKEHL